MSVESLRPVPSISLVVPAYNESRNLPGVIPGMVEALRALSPRVEIVIVDDGSRDDTVAVMHALSQQYPEVVGVQLSRNFGKEAAITAGLHATRGDVVAIMDADGQHPNALLERMLQLWREGSDVVYAVRVTRHDQSPLQARMTGWFYRFVNWGNRVQIPANAGDFRLMGRPVVEALKALPERNRFMKGLYAWVGYKSTAIDYEPQARLEGESRFGWKGAISLAMTGVVSFSSTPLRVLGAMGMLLALGAFGYGGWVVTDYFVWGNAVPGYATIVTSMMLLSGIQLLGMGVLAEYVARIYDEVKQRPAFLVQRRMGQGLSQGGAQPDAE